MEQVGFIGLGLMGEPMAHSLRKAGFAVTVYNRTPGKAKALVEKGAKLVARPEEVAAPGGIVVTMVADDRALEEVTLGTSGFGERLGKGGVHVCTSTVSPDIARRLSAWYAQRGGHSRGRSGRCRTRGPAARAGWASSKMGRGWR